MRNEIDRIIAVTNEVNLPLPPWAKYFIGLGHSAALTNSDERRLMVGVIAPRRDFLSVMSCLGVITSWAERCDSVTDDSENAELLGLEAGDSVTITEAGKKFIATFLEFDDSGNQIVMRVERVKDRMKQGIPESLWHRVAIGAIGRDKAYIRPPMSKVASAQSGQGDEFVSQALGLKTDRFFQRDHLSALVVGPMVSLKAECGIELRIPGPKIPIDARLGALLRVRSFAQDSVGDSFASDVVSDRVATIERDALGKQPDCVIFDGANAYLKHRHVFPKVPSIAIFDRRAASTQEAAVLFNECRIQDRDLEITAELVFEPPIGFEVSAYKVRVS
jgi:hypothetical protein